MERVCATGRIGVVSKTSGQVTGGVVDGGLYGKMVSSKTTWREIIMRRDVRSRQRYPRCRDGYPRKTQAVDRGASLWGEVDAVLG